MGLQRARHDLATEHKLCGVAPGKKKLKTKTLNLSSYIKQH